MARLVFFCPSGSQGSGTSLGQETPRCATGQGMWIDLDASIQMAITDAGTVEPFDPLTLGAPAIVEAWAQGFGFALVPLGVVVGIRAILRAVQ